LAASCDLVVASSDAAFATPGVKIGLFCTTPMVAVTRAIGGKRAMEMLLTGRSVPAATAAEWGLVNRVTAPDRLEAETMELAREIAQFSPYTIGLGKHAYYVQAGLDQARAYSFAQETMAANALAGDAQEGMTAFLEKRPAVWGGRKTAL
jgi:enoyl-CoA hydratase/carnithine racemase